MPVRIRLSRTGRKHFPCYRVAVFDGHTRRDGPCLENLGTYNPREKPEKKFTLDVERYHYWVSKGVQPTEALARLVKHAKATVQA